MIDEESGPSRIVSYDNKREDRSISAQKAPLPRVADDTEHIDLPGELLGLWLVLDL